MTKKRSAASHKKGLRALSFGKMFSMRDHNYNQPAGHTYAQTLRNTFSGMRQTATTVRTPDAVITPFFPADAEETEPVDVMANIEQQAIEALRDDIKTRQKLESADGMPWYGVQHCLMDHLPEHLEDRRQFAYNLVPKAMNSIFGLQPEASETFKNPATGKTWIKVIK